jgi:hypothetical protein
MKKKAQKPVSLLVVPASFICEHLFGKNHTHGHRIIVGVVIMLVGVTISKGAMMFEGIIVHYLMDAVGYGIHGIGLAPTLEYIIATKLEE